MKIPVSAELSMKFYYLDALLETKFVLFVVVFSSPEPLGSQGEFIVSIPMLCRRCSHFSIIFFSETAWPIKFKFPEEGGIKVCINGQGHMIKMAARAINSKNL